MVSKKVCLIGMSILGLGLLSGCAIAPNQVGWALIQKTTEPIVAIPPADASKLGEACASNILGFIAMGDMSIEKAKFNGGIKTVSSVNQSTFSVATFFVKKCTIVTGS